MNQTFIFSIFLPLSHCLGFGSWLLLGQLVGGGRELSDHSILHPLGLQLPDGVQQQLGVVSGQGE